MVHTARKGRGFDSRSGNMNDNKFNIEQCLTDVILDKPFDFGVGDRDFCLYPLTLAKKLLLQGQIERLALDMDILKKNPYLEALRVAHENKAVCCEILAYQTAPNTKADFYDTKSIDRRKKFFMADMGEEDVATLLVVILTSDKTEQLTVYLGLDKERERMNLIMKIKHKHGKNNVMFGGKSLFGSFIGQLKEMGYTDDQIRFELGYTYLSMMLADKVTSIYLSDEELKEIPTDMGGAMIDANNPAMKSAVMNMFKQSGVKVD